MRNKAVKAEASLWKYNCPGETDGEDKTYDIYTEANVDCEEKSRRTFLHTAEVMRGAAGEGVDRNRHIFSQW